GFCVVPHLERPQTTSFISTKRSQLRHTVRGVNLQKSNTTESNRSVDGHGGRIKKKGKGLMCGDKGEHHEQRKGREQVKTSSQLAACISIDVPQRRRSPQRRHPRAVLPLDRRNTLLGGSNAVQRFRTSVSFPLTLDRKRDSLEAK
ncbi:unnamed protein product, partial [Ixodes pacificus]